MLNLRIMTTWQEAIAHDTIDAWQLALHAIETEYTFPGKITDQDIEMSWLHNIAIEHQCRLIEA